MSFKYTLILLLVAVIAIAGFGIAQKAAPPQPSGPPVTPTPVLVTLNPTSITELDVKIGATTETDFTKTDTKWTLAKPADNSDLDQTKIDALVTELATLHGTRVVAQPGSDLAQFGLNNPRVTVTLTAGSQKQTVLVGDASVDGQSYYATTQGGSGDIQLVSGGLVSTMNALATNPPKVTPTASTAASAPAASPAASS